MSRPRVNGPRSLIITTVEAPVRGLVTLTLVPNGSRRCAAVSPLRRNGWPLAVCRPELYWVAFIETLGQALWMVPATAMSPEQVETSSRGMMSLNIMGALNSGCVRRGMGGTAAQQCNAAGLNWFRGKNLRQRSGCADWQYTIASDVRPVQMDVWCRHSMGHRIWTYGGCSAPRIRACSSSPSACAISATRAHYPGIGGPHHLPLLVR